MLQDEDEGEEFDDSDSEYEDGDDVNEEESEEEGANNEQKQEETQMHTQSEAPSSSSSLEAEALEKVKQDIRARAERLAHDLGLPFFAEPPSAQLSRQFEFLVEVAPHRVQVTQRKHAAPAKRMSPVYVDFVRGALAHRTKFGNDQRSPMARAVGVGKEPNLSVLDATGGLGKDAFVLASLGCRVTLVERNPVVHALLRDGLQRLRDADTGKEWEANLQLVHADSTQYLLALPEEERPDVIYIDPMYPHPKRRQKALTKIGMQLARALVGDDADANRLLEIAQQVARKRVVVKRPKYVAEDPRASRAYKSPRTRFEVHDTALSLPPQ